MRRLNLIRIAIVQDYLSKFPWITVFEFKTKKGKQVT